MKTWRNVALGALALATTGCVDMTLLGIPLGPQGGNGLMALGVLIPNLQDNGSCEWDPGSNTFMAEGTMELSDGKTSADTYQALIKVENTLPSNASRRTADQSPNQPGPYGGTDTNVVEIIGAHVRYEYPNGTPLDAFQRTLKRPLQGTPLVGVSTDATGVVPSETKIPVMTTLIDAEFGKQLWADTTIKDAAKSPGGYPIIAKVTLEGRSGTGTRITSNELTFRIRLTRGIIANCETMDEACQAVDPTYVAGRAGQCLPDQDFSACCNVCGVPGVVTCK